MDAWTIGILGGFLLTMPLYLFVRRRRVLDPDVPHRPRSVLLGSWLKDWLLWLISPVERAAVRRGVAPEVFNYVGLVLSAGAGAALAAGLLPLGAFLYLLCGAADVLDGRIARGRGVSSDYGAFLDSTLDRFAETFVFLGLAWYFRTWPAAGLFCLLALAGSLLVSYTRARGQAVGVDFNKGLMQRAERIVLLSAAALFDAPVTAWLGWGRGTLVAVTVFLIGAGSMVTAVYRTAAIGRRLRR
jgi:CDP-diacylglycerol--glycerol-3-phosphate 3-phosphatidyltransferase